MNEPEMEWWRWLIMILVIALFFYFVWLTDYRSNDNALFNGL